MSEKENMTAQPTCEERIDAMLRDTTAALAEIFRDLDSHEDDESAYEALDTYALSIEMRKQYRIVMSTGGPHDEFVVTVDDGEIVRIEYVFMDWFDGAQRELREGTPEWEQAERFCSYLIEAWSE